MVSLVAVSKKPGRLETMIGCLARQALSTFFTCARSRVPSPTHHTSLAPGKRANFPYPGSQVGGSFLHLPGQAQCLLQATNQYLTASDGRWPKCRQPISPYISELQACHQVTFYSRRTSVGSIPKKTFEMAVIDGAWCTGTRV